MILLHVMILIIHSLIIYLLFLIVFIVYIRISALEMHWRGISARCKPYVQKWPALISRRDRELPPRADLSGYLACNLLPANRVPASESRGNRSHLVFRDSGCSQWWGLKEAHWSPRSKTRAGFERDGSEGEIKHQIMLYLTLGYLCCCLR